MKTWNKRLSAIFVAAIVLSMAVLLVSCTPNDPTSGNDTTNGDPTGTGAVEPTIEEIALNFANGDAATAQIEGTKTVLVHTRSNYLLIEGSGYSVKLADGTEQKPDGDGKLQIENTSDNYMSMKLEITVAEKTTLTFTLIHNPGTEGNPYVIPAGGSMTIDYKEDVNFRVETGWYTVTGKDPFTLTNYELGEDGLVYLVAGTYGVGAENKKIDTSITVTAVEAPAGYSAENPTDIDALGKNERKTYKNVTLYFRFTAPADGLYIFELGDEGRSANSRFAVSADDYKTYYGRYNESDEWRYYDAGTTYAAKLNKGEQLTVAVDFTMGEYMVGEENICLNVSAPAEITKLDSTVKTSLKQRGRAYFAFTAETKGTYAFMLRGSGSVIENSLIAVFDANGQEPTYVGYGENTSVRLEAGQTAYIVVKGKKNETGEVGVAVQKSNDEPIPDGQWPSGFYANGKSFEFALYRDTKTMIYRSEEASFTYLDGEITVNFDGKDYIFFINEEGKYAVKYDEIKYDFGEDNGWGEDGEYNEEEDDGEIPTTVETVVRVLEYTPFPSFSVELKDFVGVYKTADGKQSLYVFDATGDGVFGMYRYNGNEISFNEMKNILSWGTNGVTIEAIEARDGRVYKIKVTANLEEVGEFTLTDEAVTTPPEELPEEVTAKYYYGEGGYELGNGSLNNAQIYILRQIDGGYLVSACAPGYERMIMQMIISEDNETIRLLDSKGDVLSTLTTQAQSGGESGGSEDDDTVDKTHVGEYVSADGTLKLYWDGTLVSYTKGEESLSVGKIAPTISDDGVYKFTYRQGANTVTFRFTEDGNIALNDSALGEFTLIKQASTGGEDGGSDGDEDEPIERNEDGIPYLSSTNKPGWRIEDGVYGDYNETYLCAKKSGWYTFTASDDNCQLLPVIKLKDPDWKNKIVLDGKAKTIYMEEGELIAFINADFLYVTYSESNPDAGKTVSGTKDDPFVWDGSDLDMDTYREDATLFYITFTATKTGQYQFNFIKEGTKDMQMHLIYDGKTYGRVWDSENFSWSDEGTLPLTLNLTEGQQITFVVARGLDNLGGWTLVCTMP